MRRLVYLLLAGRQCSESCVFSIKECDQSISRRGGLNMTRQCNQGDVCNDGHVTILTQMCAVSPTPQDLAKETFLVGSTMLHRGCADSLCMEGAGVMIIGSRQRHFVSRDVSYLQNKVRYDLLSTFIIFLIFT